MSAILVSGDKFMTTTRESVGRKWNLFKSVSDAPIREQDALTEQIHQGYPPAGYGFYSFETTVTIDGKFTATWKCSGSCE